MAEVVRMPAILAGAEEAAIQTWLVAVGDDVVVGQALAEIETDKAVVEFIADASGSVGRLLAEEGDSVTVGDPIIVLLAAGDGEDTLEAALLDAGAAGTAGDIPVLPSPALAAFPAAEPNAEEPAPSMATPEPARLFVSPLVRRLAAASGYSLSSIPGSGPNGRITRRDFERFIDLNGDSSREPDFADVVAPAPPAPPALLSESEDFVDMPLSRMRRTIARRLVESKSTVPHFYLVAECRVDRLFELRQTVNESSPQRISVNDFVVKAAAGAMRDVPDANVAWNGDSLRRFTTVDISIAVASDDGLTTPVVRAADRLPLTMLSLQISELAARAREGTVRQHELEGGSLSISNLGMYGTAQFSAILNPPQAMILAVGVARRAPVVTEDGELGVGRLMTVTLSADHRAVDGALAAQWLAAFQRRIENPLTILI